MQRSLHRSIRIAIAALALVGCDPLTTQRPALLHRASSQLGCPEPHLSVHTFPLTRDVLVEGCGRRGRYAYSDAVGWVGGPE